jgi:hypothetical protein
MAKEEQEHDFLIDDIARATKRAAGAKYLDASKEFADQAYPLMHAMAEMFGERMTRVEEALDAMIEQTESFLQPDLARRIMATLELGKLVADLAAKSPNKELQHAALAYATAYELTIEIVEEATVAPSTGPDDDDEEGDEEDEEEEGETGEVMPVAAAPEPATEAEVK